MPIYEYECDGCHTVFEVRQKVSDPAPTAHSCGSDQVRRILSATSFVLKGTGWYATDYGNRSNAPKEGTGAAKPEAAKSSGDTNSASASSNPSGGSDKPAAPAAAKAAPSPATPAGRKTSNA